MNHPMGPLTLADLIGLDTCLLKDGKDCFRGRLLQEEDGETVYNRLKNEAKNEDDLITQALEIICLTCQLFGNGFSASRIFFSDLYPDTDSWAGVTQIRDGVVIDRDSEKAVDRLKFDFEVVPAGTAFYFEIRLENPQRRMINAKEREIDLGLTCLGLNEFCSGLGHLGGNRSRGLGSCEMEIDSLYSTDFTDLEQLKRYLLHTELEQKMAVTTEKIEIQDFIQQSIMGLLE